MKDMVIRKFKIDELNPAKYNPRKALKPGDKEFEKLENSIKNFGYVELIVVNVANNNTVISGHQRLSVLKHLGETEVECVVVELGENEEKALNIAMNKVSGSWDEEKLAELLQDLDAVQFNTDLTGFEKQEIAALCSKLFDKDVQEDNFDVDAELKNPAFSKEGDIWHLGKHTVICGDSILPETYEKLLGDTKVNLVCTDPPYLVKLESTSGTIKNDDLDDEAGYDFLKSAFCQFHDAMADDASAYIFYASSKARVFHDAYEDAGLRVSIGLMWKKDRLVLSRTDWKPLGEPIIYGWKKDGKHQWYGDQKQTTIFEFPRLKSSKEEGFGHPSSKPVPLIAYLIKQSTMTNGLVLDGFLGSASTLIACEQLGRICYGIELEPKFVDVAVMRYYQYSKENRNTFDPDKEIYVIRDGQKLTLDEVKAKEE